MGLKRKPQPNPTPISLSVSLSANGAIPGRVGMAYIRKITEQVKGGKPVSNTPPMISSSVPALASHNNELEPINSLSVWG